MHSADPIPWRLPTPFARRCRKTALGVIIFGLSWCALGVALDRYGQRDVAGRFDAIVVAGCRVDPNGRASLTLARRTRHAVALFERGVAPKLVFTGGVGDYPPSEAEAAAVIARRAGVPGSAIVLEDRSTSTEENARFAAELIGEDARIVVVSDAYHIFRSQRVFRRYFAEVVGSGSLGPRSIRARGALREVLAVGIYGALGRL